MSKEFIVSGHFNRFPAKSVEVKAFAVRDPWEDFKILQNGYEKYYQLQEGDIVVEGGAYIGMFSCYAGLAVGPAGSVYSYEPITEHIPHILRNVALNELSNVVVTNKGLWSHDTDLLIEHKGPESSMMHFTNAGNPTTKVSVESIDKTFANKEVNFIKLDVEGAELRVLRGAVETLKNNPRINLSIASYHNQEGFPTYQAVEAFLHELGFTVRTDCPEHLTTYAWKK